MVCHKSERVHNVRFPFSGISSLTYLPIRSTEHLSYPHLRFNMSGVKLGFAGSEERELNILPKEKERETWTGGGKSIKKEPRVQRVGGRCS